MAIKKKAKKVVVRNQRTDVLNYLKKHKKAGITQMDAYRKFPAPITRLAAVIFDLRKMGYDIESVEEVGKNCYGTVSYVRYVLK